MIHSGVAVWGSLLFTIGRVYCAMADRHLGYAEGFLGLKGHRAAWKERKHAAKANFSGGFWFWVWVWVGLVHVPRRCSEPSIVMCTAATQTLYSTGHRQTRMDHSGNGPAA